MIPENLRGALAGAFAGMTVLAPQIAWTADPQALFDEAMVLIEKRAFESACPKLEEVVRLAPKKIGARMELSRCYDEWGKPISARDHYLVVADMAAAAKDPREAKARAKIEELARRAPKLTIVVSAHRGTDGFSVQRDERALATAEWDVPVAVDPGKHVITASAPGKRTWTTSIDVQNGSATVEVPPLVALAPGSDTALVWPWVVGGVGIAALGVAAGFGADGLVARGSLNELCGQQLSPCAGHGAAEIDPLNARKNRGLGVFLGAGIAGAAAVIAGVVGLAGGQATAKKASAITVVPVVAPGWGGAMAQGRF